VRESWSFNVISALDRNIDTGLRPRRRVSLFEGFAKALVILPDQADVAG
jgi:hypothetical protein